MLTSESHSLITTKGRKTRIVDPKEVPLEIVVFMTHAKEQTVPTYNHDTITTSPTSPPRTEHHSYASVVSTEVTTVTNSQLTQSNQPSELSNIKTRIDFLWRVEVKITSLEAKF